MINYFDLLDLPAHYGVDKKQLHDSYLAKQRRFHPDFAMPENKQEYIAKSMLINEAYKILSDEYHRAEYILKLNGFEFNEQLLRNKLSPQELENIVERHELLNELENIDDLEYMYQKHIGQKSELILELVSLFEQKNFPKALDITIRLKYLTNLVGNIKSKIKHANSRYQ